MHIGRWDLGTPAYQPGAWLGGTIYPQRCDLSPDGRWFAYFALKPSARWELGTTYIAISRLPWLTALAGWATGGTWTRGVHFVEDRSIWEVSEPPTSARSARSAMSSVCVHARGLLRDRTPARMGRDRGDAAPSDG